MKNQQTDAMSYLPAVYAVGESYQIVMPFAVEAIVKVAVGDRVFYDDTCGVLRSSDRIHRVEVPMSLLDAAREYSVIYRVIIDRKAYYPEMEEEVCVTFDFRPLPQDREIRIYHLSDTHNMVEEPVAASGYLGDAMDLLILNGDIPNHAGKHEHLETVFKLASAVAKGNIPVICTRGNHDDRGRCAEDFLNYIPHQNGKTYYTTRMGRYWFLILDCGEDKTDDHEEYGNTICFHPFRRAETEFLKDVIHNAEKEYLAEGVEHRLVVCHIPFTFSKLVEPFDIEKELYAEWARMMREEIHPELMLCGHRHLAEVWEVGGKNDVYGQACPVIVGSRPIRHKDTKEKEFIGCAITLGDGSAKVVFNHHSGEIRGEQTIPLCAE
ncbi:MAG: metallophosphoesterase [Clostridia bacterium]|nr:metallophosphoesterase [Clostridia bacterium]